MLQILVDTPVSPLAPVSPTANGYAVWLSLGLVLVVLCSAFGLAIKHVLKRHNAIELIGLTKPDIQERWRQIEDLSSQGGMGMKLAIIEADKLLDQVLKSMAMPGDTLGERLRSTSYTYPKIRDVWPAHKLRNQLVHDTTFNLPSVQAKDALHRYRHALQVVSVL